MLTKYKKADYYDDPDFNYLHYWDNRAYEHASENMAIKKLLKGKHFASAVDIGGGYGRLCVLLENYADKVTLAEPSQQQLDIAKDFLKDHPEIDRLLTQADDIKLTSSSQELVTMIRVMHHLPDPTREFSEIARILKPGGYFLLEVANYSHGVNRAKYLIRGKRLPRDPVDIRSESNQGEDRVAFVNHNPRTVLKQLAHAGFKMEKTLSVSNLRSNKLKKVVPKSVMLGAEKVMQPTFARLYFGPSVFFLLKKIA